MFKRNECFEEKLPMWDQKTLNNLHKTNIMTTFQFHLCGNSCYKDAQSYTAIQTLHWSEPSSTKMEDNSLSCILSSCFAHHSSHPKVQFQCSICMSEHSSGVAEWPVPPLTLRFAVTLHHPIPHLGWCGHLATGARVRRSWTRGYWEINRYAWAQLSDLPACLAGWLPPFFLTLLLPPFPC